VPLSIVLEHLRRIDRKVDKSGDDVTELKTRTIALEAHGELSCHGSDIARINQRLDHIERRLELIEVRAQAI